MTRIQMPRAARLKQSETVSYFFGPTPKLAGRFLNWIAFSGNVWLHLAQVSMWCGIASKGIPWFYWRSGMAGKLDKIYDPSIRTMGSAALTHPTLTGGAGGVAVFKNGGIPPFLT